MEGHKSAATKLDVPLTHLDYSYISTCKDAKEMEKIIKVLRSGTEGRYPHLEETAENKLEALNPSSKLLRKDQRIMTSAELDAEDRQRITSELEDWTSEIKSKEPTLDEPQVNKEKVLPPVRGQSTSIPVVQKVTTEATDKPPNTKRVQPRDYKEWDKVDIEAELDKVDRDDKKKEVKNVLRHPNKPQIPHTLDTSDLTDEEKHQRAEREKDKGNEAFRCGDYEEAVIYYSRSISIVAMVAAINNRAQSYIKLKQWANAIADCSNILKRDPSNVKALLRRSIAHQEKKSYLEAKKDIETVLDKEPSNARAKEILKELEKLLAEQKVKGRRMLIEEVSGSDDENASDGEDRNDADDSLLTDKIPDAHEDHLNKPHMNGVSADFNRGELDGELEYGDGQNAGDKCQGGHGQNSLPEDQHHVPNTSGRRSAHQSAEVGGRDELDIKTPARGAHQDGPGQSVSCEPSAGQAADAMTANKNELVEAASVERSRGELAPDEADTASQAVYAESSSQATHPPSPLPPLPESSSQATRPPSPPPPLPDAVAALKDKGNSLFRSGQYAEAIEVYSKAIDKLASDVSQTTNSSILLSNRAACKSKIGDCRSAVSDCSLALETNPGAIKALLRRAVAYENMEKYREAYVDYRQVLYQDSSTQVAQQGSTRCGQMLQQQDGPRWRDSLPSTTAASSQATATKPALPAPTAARPAPAPQSSLPSTTAASSQATATKPAARPASTPQSSRSADKGTRSKLGEKPTLTQEQLFDKYKTVGNNLVQKKEYKLAIDCYTKCMECCPGRVAAYTNRALCYLKMDQPAKVLDDCNLALVLENRNVKALFRRAQAYKLLKRYSECTQDLQTVLKVEPANTAATSELATINNLQTQREQQQARERQSTQGRKKIPIQVVESSEEEEEEEEDKKKKKEVEDDKQMRFQLSAEQSTRDQPKPTQSSAKLHMQPQTENTMSSKESNTSPQHQAGSSKPSATMPGNTAQPSQGKARKAKAKKGRSNIIPTAGAGVKRPPPPAHIEKATPYEFMYAWNSLKGVQEIEPYAGLLQQIQPQDLPKMVSNKLDGDMLLKLVASVGLLLDQGKTSGGFQYMKMLSKLSRFDMNVMFLSDNDKTEILNVFKKLDIKGSVGYTSSDVENLKQVYGLS